jgi:prepilin peptidase CpaA
MNDLLLSAPNVNGMDFIGIVILMALLAAATWTDIRSNRIPNALVVAGAIVGVACGLAPGGIGLEDTALGVVAGFFLLLPLYAIGIMGAGDVKLMAMTGIFLGVNATLLAGLATFAAGGILAVGYGLKSGVMLEALRNVRTFAGSAVMHLASGGAPSVADMPVTPVRLPYAAAIAAGALISVLVTDFSWPG